MDYLEVWKGLEVFEGEAACQRPGREDWLLEPDGYTAGVYRAGEVDRPEVVMDNGLVRRTWRLQPNAACVGFDNLMDGNALLRAVSPEARVKLDGKEWDVGGLVGQEERAYLRREWVDGLEVDPAAFVLVGIETGPTRAPFSWARKRYSEGRPWPPPGVGLMLRFAAPEGGPRGVEVEVHYELYDGIPLLCKWIEVKNGGERAVRLDAFTSEVLAAAEYEVSVDGLDHWEHGQLYVETDYAFHSMTPKGAAKAVYWVEDTDFTTQINYKLTAPVTLECRPPLGPEVDVVPGASLVSFRSFELVLDSAQRERRGLALRRMYRTVAPWCTENPMLMHVRHAEPEAVKAAIDQCAAVGFEMVIMTFGSGFNAESDDTTYIAQLKELADFAHQKGVELGGYSLLASRAISEEDDVIDPKTGERGHAVFGNSPCLCSEWGRRYFEKVERLFTEAGLDVLEHDGSYPGDVCASTEHPDHEGLGDSQWRQWRRIADFYRRCRGRGTYLNVPDWYFLNGSSKNGMGYREVNWSLPRARQILLARQNMYDGTWEKTPSMGWMFVPLVEYHGGGAEATLEPLSEHLEHYGMHLAQNFGWGVQACYRGPRLYDTDETKAVVAKWVAFYKKYRRILDADVVHLRRPDGRDLDGVLHVDPQGDVRGMAVLFNPLEDAIERRVRLPLYYTGLTDTAYIRQEDGDVREYALDRNYEVELAVAVAAGGMTWLVIECAG